MFILWVMSKRERIKVFEKIKELEEVPSFSKHDRLVQGIINAIDEKLIARDDMLPSVNTMIKELHFSRETIVKGFRELISRGIIESKNRLGYFDSMMPRLMSSRKPFTMVSREK